MKLKPEKKNVVYAILLALFFTAWITFNDFDYFKASIGYFMIAFLALAYIFIVGSKRW